MACEKSSAWVDLSSSQVATGATVYSGVAQIPVCYGSAAVPASTGPRQRLYQRVCYIRDGSDLPLDAYYRWRWNRDAKSRQQQQQRHHMTVMTSTAGGKRKRDRTEVGGERGTTHRSVDPGTTAVPSSSSAASPKNVKFPYCEVMVHSPSPLYSIIDHVDFVLPRSFPHPRRSVFEPPFMVQDATWAEHMVEIHLYFKAELLIPPMMFLHHCRLYPPVEAHPCLSALSGTTANSSSTMPKKSTALVGGSSRNGVMPPKEGSTNKSNSEALSTPASAAAAVVTPDVVVSERKDILRIFHPSVGVVEFLKGVSLFAEKMFSEEEYQYFLEDVYYNTAKPSTPHGSSGKWRLPFEEEIEKYAEGRLERSLSVLKTVIEDLRQEQEQLLDNASFTLGSIIEEAYQVQISLRKLRQACLSNTM